MNAQVYTQSPDTEVSLERLADASVVEQQLANLEQLSNEKLNAYYARRDELKQEISELTKTGNQSAIDAAKSDLGNVEKEIAKRAENIGLIMSAIGHEMGMLDQLGEKLSQDAPEDIAKREAAHATLARAEAELVEAKAAKTAAESMLPTLQAELAKAEGTFDFFGVVDLLGKAEKVASAKRKLSDAESTIAKAPTKIADLEEALGKARLAIASVEEEIEVDKDHRLKSLNLDQLYAKLTDAEARVSAIVKENIESLEKNQANTQVQLVFNRDLRVSSAEELEVLEAEIAAKKAEFGQKKAQLEDMVGQETSPAYQKLENEAAELATLIDTKLSEKRIVEGKISTAQVNVSELEASMRALNSDVLLAKSNYNDFVLTAEKARVAGDNIALLLKTQAAKVSADSLSKGRDAVTLAALDASIATDVANKKTMADNAGRRLSLLDEIAQRTARGEEAGAAHDADYAEKTEAYKEKYGKLGKGGTGGSSPDGADKAPAGDGDSNGSPKLF